MQPSLQRESLDKGRWRYIIETRFSIQQYQVTTTFGRDPIGNDAMNPHKAEKKREILEAAVQVFAQTGYHNAKMAKIAEVAGVGAGSLYLYYRNKEDILEQISINLWEELTDKLDLLAERKDLTIAEKLDAQGDLLFDLFIHNADMATIFVTEYHQLIAQEKTVLFPYVQRFMKTTEYLLKEGQRSGIFNPSINPKVFVHFLFGGFRRLLFEWAQAPDELSLSDIRQDLKILVKRGISLG